MNEEKLQSITNSIYDTLNKNKLFVSFDQFQDDEIEAIVKELILKELKK